MQKPKPVKEEIEELEFIKDKRNITSVKYDLNYKNIKKQFKQINFSFGLWNRYCNWFNDKFNKKEILSIENFKSEE